MEIKTPEHDNISEHSEESLSECALQTLSPGRKKWTLLKNVLKASALLKSHEVKVIQNLDDLVEDVMSSPLKIKIKHSRTLTSEVISDHKAAEKLFFLIQRSSEEDLIEINDLIENDPRRFTRNRSDPDSFVNKSNLFGIRPLYEACKNGYMSTVQLLLDHGADPHLFSEISKKENENCLEVSCRWSHISVVRCLLNNSNWSGSEVKRALKQTKNKNLIELLNTKLPGKSGWICGN